MSYLSKSEISGWGLYPRYKIIKSNFKSNITSHENIIARGNGRSYGDSSISKNIFLTKKLNKIISYNSKKGLINVESGVKIDEIINLTLIDGCFYT